MASFFQVPTQRRRRTPSSNPAAPADSFFHNPATPATPTSFSHNPATATSFSHKPSGAAYSKLLAYSKPSAIQPHRDLQADRRRLKEVVSNEKHEIVAVEAKEHNNKLDNLEVPSKETHLPDADELTGMDYAAASKKPPTHN
ncbi:unnamed protein product [Linum tenue]|uniref:Uncharacterized protein n=1 Tax=Linum tenue TaxID=586396 RepID=A0AAV0L2S7_9ROSI|nr:unnamed protein product [Linum tenue]